MNAQVVAALLLAASAAGESPADWSRFRGPNGSGVSGARNVPHGVRPDEEPAVEARASAGTLVADPAGRSPLRDRIARRPPRDDCRGSRNWTGAVGARRPEVKTNVVDKRNNPARPQAPPSRRTASTSSFPTTGSWHTTGQDASNGECRSDHSPTSMAWAPRQ